MTGYAMLAMASLAFALWLAWAVRGASLHRRPILLAFAILSWLPLFYVGLVFAELVPDHRLRFERPLFTWVGAVVVPWMAHRLTSLSSRTSPKRRALTELFILASALAAAFVLPGPELGRAAFRLTVLVAVDRSRSIDLVPSAQERIANELAALEPSMKEGDRVGVVVFAAGAAVEDPPRPKSELPAPQKIELGRDATDLAAGIRRALEEAPQDSATRIVLLSDGVATRGDAMQAALKAAAAEVPIDVVPLDQQVLPDVRLVSVGLPARADENEPMALRIVTHSPSRAEVEVRIKRNGRLVQRGQATIEAGEDVIRLREIAPEPGLHRYDVEITALDPSLDLAPEDNAGTAFVRVRGEALALVVDGDGLGDFVAKALEDAAFRVSQGGATALPTSIDELARYDLVVLSDVRAALLSEEQLEALASYARDLGGGLILMGGDRSMGPGGYGKTPIEEVSPVSFDVKNERKRASLAEVIAIDYSGSMGMTVASGQTKLTLANEAAARSARLLGPGDRIGVAHVDTALTWTVPLGPLNDVEAIARRIHETSVGGGGIYMDLALRESYAALEREKTGLKHLLVFADGNDAERLDGCRALVSTALSRGITTSVVALGRGHDIGELEALSRLGSGRFYLVEDATRLPAVFAEETVLAARSSIHEIDFRPLVAQPGAPIQGIDFATAPLLKGYVVTTKKPRATVLLEAAEGDPLLATWSVGLGRVAAFTSDLKDRWGVDWTSWPEASRMMGQLGRDVARKAEDPRVRTSAEITGGELSVRTEVVGDDGRAQSFRRLSAIVAGPSGFSRELALEPMAAGSYAAALPLSRPGTYVVTTKDEATGEIVGTSFAVLSAGEELRPTGTDRALLARIAGMTGGKVRDTLAGVFHDRPTSRFSYLSLTNPLLMAAALLMLLGVAARRLALPDWASRLPVLAKEKPAHAAAATGSRTPDELAAPLPTEPVAEPAAEKRAPAPPPSTLGSLLQRKARSELARAEAPSPPAAPLPQAPPSPPQVAHPPPPPPPPQTGERPLTAAEILLARRRGKRS